MNYGEFKNSDDLSEFTGATIVPSKENPDELIITNYKDGAPESSFTIDPTTDSIEEILAETFPEDDTPPPVDENGDLDLDQIDLSQEPPIDFYNVPVLVDPSCMEQFEDNIEELPYEAESDDSDYYCPSAEELREQAEREMEKEEEALHNFEKFCDNM